MTSQIYVNLPVENVARSTAFYEALGFRKNPKYSDEDASCMVWSDEIIAMLLDYDLYEEFIYTKHIADTHATSGVILSLTLGDREQVQQFADAATRLGARVYTVDIPSQPEGMFGYEVEDPDGHVWEPVCMEEA